MSRPKKRKMLWVGRKNVISYTVPEKTSHDKVEERKKWFRFCDRLTTLTKQIIILHNYYKYQPVWMTISDNSWGLFFYETRCRWSFQYTELADSDTEQELSYRQQIVRKLRTQYAEGIYRLKYYTLTLKSRLRVTQDHWKWFDHTRLSSGRVIWRWIQLWPWNVG